MSTQTIIQIAHSHFLARVQFFNDLLRYIDNPEVVRRIEEDGITGH